MQYTLDQFQEKFDDAQSPEAKETILNSFIESVDEQFVLQNTELIKELKAQIQDAKEFISIEEDFRINAEIEAGFMKLYTCTKSIDNFIEGNNYYVKIDDVKAKYLESFEGEIPDSIKEYFNSIKPIIWIVTDNGIGTLKTKSQWLESLDFSQYFTDFSIN